MVFLRYIKEMIMGKNYRMLAKTLFGMEDLLASELRSLGAGNVETGVRNVTFEGDKGFMYKANLCCRTAIRILKPIKSFNVFNEEDLYKQVYDFPWEEYMDVNQTLAVDSTVFSDYFTNSMFISLKTKDAIVDRFRDREGTRPSVDLDFPDLRINVHIDRNIVTISLDSSGESLHKRSYKVENVEAPINEVLAAGIIMLSGWEGQSNFLDPMCGSGTFLIEAAMIACNIPANINREEFGFELWKDFDEELYNTIEHAMLKRIREHPHKIMGYDKDPIAVEKTLENIKSANLTEFIQVSEQDFFESEKEGEKALHIMFNPPYDERLRVEDVETFYGEIGSTLKHSYPGSQAWFISSNMEGLKNVGLRPFKRVKLFNGQLESRLVGYEMYKGSKKGKSRS